MIITFAALVAGRPGWAGDRVSFRRDVAPIFLEHCVACHGAKKAEGGYRLDTFAQMLKPGDSGEPPIGHEHDDASELLARLITTDPFQRMPSEGEPLVQRQVALIKKWIAEGAEFDGEDSDERIALVIPPAKHPDPPESYPATVPIAALAFCPDETQVMVGGYHEVTVWSVSSGKLIRRLGNLGQRVFAIAVSADDKTIAVATGEPGRSGEVRLIDLPSGQVKGVAARSTDVMLDVAFRPEGRQLAIASADNLIRIVDVNSMRVVRTLASHADWVTAIAWTDDGSRLVSASRDRSAKVFDADSGELLTSYQGHAASVTGITFSADGDQVYSVGADRKLHRWNAKEAKKVAEIDLESEGQALVRGDQFVLIPSKDKRVLKIGLGENKLIRSYLGHDDWVLSTALNHDHSRLVSGAFNGEVRVWKTESGELINAWLAKP